MVTVPFAFYDAFSDVPFGGSQAAVVSDAASFDDGLRARIAKETGMPATAFIESVEGDLVRARFLSTVKELPMCGHGTICLMTRLAELDAFDHNDGERVDIELALPSGSAKVELTQRVDGRIQVMLDVRVPDFRQGVVDVDRLTELLGFALDDLHGDFPLETVSGDFEHLVTPVKDLAAMRKIAPDFPALINFCHDIGVETVVAFSTEVERPGNDLHVRDFCPAVGVWESASAGTTNAALAAYLIRHGIIEDDGSGQITINAEQGHEINRASSIRSVVTMDNRVISRLQVGGVATKVFDGQLHLPG